MSGTESFHVTLREAWEAAAEAWSDYVRAGRDPFFHVSLAAFLELLPGPRGTTLDIGCGEGRVGAELERRGYRVLGVEQSPTLAARARERHEVVEADAADLPFADARFPLVVSFNSLMDMDDAAGAVREAARVLEPAGRFCGDEPDAPFVFQRPYFERRDTHERFERAGLAMTFHSRLRPLEDYTRALEDAGFLLDALREPADPGDDEQWKRIPNFLYLRAL